MKKTKILAALLLLTLSVSLQMQATEVIHNKTYNAQNNGGGVAAVGSVLSGLR